MPSHGRVRKADLCVEFGRRLRDWRRSRNWARRAVAAEVGVSVQVVSD